MSNDYVSPEAAAVLTDSALAVLARLESGACVHLDDWGARDTDRCTTCNARRERARRAAASRSGGAA